MNERMQDNPSPCGIRFLNAGPRAGKTTLLRRWMSEMPPGAVFVALTPEDREPDLFQYRLLRALPCVQDRFGELRGKFSEANWGGLLGIAIAEAQPDLRLLLDDFQEIESSPTMEVLLSLIRHFPASGSLFIASRHQPPELTAVRMTLWSADFSDWQEAPEAGDLLQLPQPLRDKALSLFVVGESPPDTNGWELVRRNIAHVPEDMAIRLRPSWREAAGVAITYPLPDQTWQEIESGIRQFVQVHFRTARESEYSEILRRIPYPVRQQRPFLLQARGDLLFNRGRISEAKGFYDQALASTASGSSEDLDLRIRLASIQLEQEPLAVGPSTLPLEALSSEISPVQRCRLLNLKGRLALNTNDKAGAEAAFRSVLAVSALDDRPVLSEQFSALTYLHLLSNDLGFTAQAEYYAEQAISLAEENSLQSDLLFAFLNRLGHRWFRKFSPNVPLTEFTAIPLESFLYPSPKALTYYIYLLGLRAAQFGEYGLAIQMYQLCRALTRRSNYYLYLYLCNQALLEAYGAAGKLPEARSLYSELRSDVRFDALRFHTQINWIKLLVRADFVSEAREAIEQELPLAVSDPQRAKFRLLQLWVRHRQGDGMARGEVRDLLEQPDNSFLWDSEAQLLGELGIRELSPVFRIRGFGMLTMFRDQENAVRWPRKKALSLLAHLVLNRQGCASTYLADRLFGDAEALEAVHLAAHSLRQVMKALAAGDLLESVNGIYRIKWSGIAYCDLHEFEAFFQIAESLEERGQEEAAATFYAVALMQATGPLFENLPDEFEAERREYAERIGHARSVASRHAASRLIGV